MTVTTKQTFLYRSQPAKLDRNQEVDIGHLRVISTEAASKDEGKLMASESGMNRTLYLTLLYIYIHVHIDLNTRGVNHVIIYHFDSKWHNYDKWVLITEVSPMKIWTFTESDLSFAMFNVFYWSFLERFALSLPKDGELLHPKASSCKSSKSGNSQSSIRKGSQSLAGTPGKRSEVSQSKGTPSRSRNRERDFHSQKSINEDTGESPGQKLSQQATKNEYVSLFMHCISC